MRHVIELCAEGSYRPDIATLDCGTLNFGDGNRAYISTPDYCRQGAGILRDLGVKVELEVFDTGNLWFVKQMIKEGLIPAPAMIQLCTGIPYGVPADVGHLLAMVNSLPADCIWTSFAVSRMQMPWVAQSILLGGNVRVGLEDNLYLWRGVYASNAQLVEKARTIIEAMGARILSPAAGARAAAAALNVAGIPIYATAVLPEWIDYNGHLRDAYYALIVSLATDALMDRIGLDAAYRGAHPLHAVHGGDAHPLPARGAPVRPVARRGAHRRGRPQAHPCRFRDPARRAGRPGGRRGSDAAARAPAGRGGAHGALPAGGGGGAHRICRRRAPRCRPRRPDRGAWSCAGTAAP